MYLNTVIHEESAEAVEDQVRELMRQLELLSGSRMQDDISFGQYRVMAVIHEHGSISVGNLGRLIGSAQSTASEMAARLTKTGLVTKVRGPDDGRVVLVELTEKGRQLMRRRKKVLRETYQKLLDSLSEEERNQFVEAVWTLNDILAAAATE